MHQWLWFREKYAVCLFIAESNSWEIFHVFDLSRSVRECECDVHGMFIYWQLQQRMVAQFERHSCCRCLCCHCCLHPAIRHSRINPLMNRECRAWHNFIHNSRWIVVEAVRVRVFELNTRTYTCTHSHVPHIHNIWGGHFCGCDSRPRQEKYAVQILQI